MDFHKLIISKISPETPDTVTVEFQIPEHLRDAFAYTQGQHITVRHEISGHEVRRSYSMSSSPLEERFAVTVKKVAGGRMSAFLHDSLKPGDTLEVAPPDGRFFVKLDPDKRRTYYVFGAGERYYAAHVYPENHAGGRADERHFPALRQPRRGEYHFPRRTGSLVRTLYRPTFRGAYPESPEKRSHRQFSRLVQKIQFQLERKNRPDRRPCSDYFLDKTCRTGRKAIATTSCAVRAG